MLTPALLQPDELERIIEGLGTLIANSSLAHKLSFDLASCVLGIGDLLTIQPVACAAAAVNPQVEQDQMRILVDLQVTP